MQILFASIPAAGHFNPLTGLAAHLRTRGHDVRWYTGPTYRDKLAALAVPHYPFVRATDVNGENVAEMYPEYKDLGLGPKAIAFALEKVFFVNLEAHLHDILDLREDFPFEAIVFDGGFYAGRLVAEKTGARAYPVWPGPTPAPVSRQAPPPFFGLRPMRGPFGKLRDALVMKMVQSSAKGGMKIWRELRAREGLPAWEGNLFDVHNETSTAMFMVGSPGMDFPRDDWPKNMHFVGPLVAHKKPGGSLPLPVAEKIAKHRGKVVVVAQGTIDNRDPEKLFAPALTAFTRPALAEYLAIATTGGRHTETLRARFPHGNVVVEDWLDYDALMPHASLFVSNGGAGSVMQALVNGVPLLLAGKLEAKNDINARLDWRGVALDLRTERPSTDQIERGATRVLGTGTYRENVKALRAELATYDPFAIIEEIVVGTSARMAETRAS
jgi:UDP:flavonoid glycosyltransferase YjiC (YdhE family)